jgi:hypothetical protein
LIAILNEDFVLVRSSQMSSPAFGFALHQNAVHAGPARACNSGKPYLNQINTYAPRTVKPTGRRSFASGRYAEGSADLNPAPEYRQLSSLAPPLLRAMLFMLVTSRRKQYNN